jgi:hypothetical protein
MSNGQVKSEPIMQKGISDIPMIVAKIPAFILAQAYRDAAAGKNHDCNECQFRA